MLHPGEPIHTRSDPTCSWAGQVQGADRHGLVRCLLQETLAHLAHVQELAALAGPDRVSAGCQAGSPKGRSQQGDPHAAYLQARSRHLAAAAGQLSASTSWGDALGLSGRMAEDSSPDASPRRSTRSQAGHRAA